jgi:calcineurin-like phosphoesterase family protein
MIFFTSDTHFNHQLMAHMRGYNSIKEHDDWLIHCWNQQVKRGDIVWHLGDFCFGDHKIVRSIRAKLNGAINLVRGNHDIANRIHNIKGLFSSISDIKEVKIKGNRTILCHYAFRTWASSHYNSWSCHGHSHGGLLPQGKQLDVDIGSNRGILYTEDDILAIMKLRPDNFNYINKSITP